MHGLFSNKIPTDSICLQYHPIPEAVFTVSISGQEKEDKLKI